MQRCVRANLCAVDNAHIAKLKRDVLVAQDACCACASVHDIKLGDDA